jgi:DNA-binding NarL/FixJ family response regulator
MNFSLIAEMSLTERERTILKLANEGLSSYKIARTLGVDPPTIARSKKNALRKLKQAQEDLDFAKRIAKSTCSEHVDQKEVEIRDSSSSRS